MIGSHVYKRLAKVGESSLRMAALSLNNYALTLIHRRLLGFYFLIYMLRYFIFYTSILLLCKLSFI